MAKSKGFLICYVIITLLFSLTKCENLEDTNGIAVTGVILGGAALSLGSGSSSDSPEVRDAESCYGLDNDNCAPGLQNDAIWEIEIQEFNSTGSKRTSGDLSDFTHLLELRASNQTWHSHFFVKMPGTDEYVYELREGDLSFSDQSRDLVRIILDKTSCVDSSLIDIYGSDDFNWKIRRNKSNSNQVSLIDPAVDPIEKAKRAANQFESGNFLTRILDRIFIFATVYIVESLFYTFTEDFWLRLIDGNFYYNDYLWQQLNNYQSKSTLSCFSDQGIEDFYQLSLVSTSEEDLKEKVCEQYIQGYLYSDYPDEEIADECADFLEEQLIEDACGDLSGIERDLCIDALNL